MTAEVSTQQETDREIVVSRIIEGPRKVVFDAFTDVTNLGKWWVPDGSTITTRTFEFRPGGVWDATIQRPGGGELPTLLGSEIAPPERIAGCISDEGQVTQRRKAHAHARRAGARPKRPCRGLGAGTPTRHASTRARGASNH